MENVIKNLSKIRDDLFFHLPLTEYCRRLDFPNTKQYKFLKFMKNYGAWCGVVWRWWWRGAFHISLLLAICIYLCPCHMLAQAQAAIVEGCLRRRGASSHVQATAAVAAAVAVCWHLMAMPLAPIKLSKQWSIEGAPWAASPSAWTRKMSTRPPGPCLSSSLIRTLIGF